MSIGLGLRSLVTSNTVCPTNRRRRQNPPREPILLVGPNLPALYTATVLSKPIIGGLPWRSQQESIASEPVMTTCIQTRISFPLGPAHLSYTVAAADRPGYAPSTIRLASPSGRNNILSSLGEQNEIFSEPTDRVFLRPYEH
jgi:hypothetical protein